MYTLAGRQVEMCTQMTLSIQLYAKYIHVVVFFIFWALLINATLMILNINNELNINTFRIVPIIFPKINFTTFQRNC